MDEQRDEEFEFADFDVTSKEWEGRNDSATISIVNGCSDNGRAAWDDESAR